MAGRGGRILAVLAIGGLLSLLTPAVPAVASPTPAATKTPIKHFLFLMQGDRSFDNYFGTYPGADGVARGVCQPQLTAKAPCVKPYALPNAALAPLGANASVVAKQYHNGKMDGFVSALQGVGRDGTKAMGYYDQRSLPAYWRAASQYVLFDRFFSSSRAGVRSNRAYWVSATDAATTGTSQPATIFDRLQAAGVSWKFYVQNLHPTKATSPGAKTGSNTQDAAVPLLNYSRFTADPALRSHIVDLSQYYTDLQDGTLPAVAYFASSSASERSSRSMSEGQNLVVSLTGQLMLSRYWSSSAFLWSYDGSGGFYDHVLPPQVDAAGYGLRVPALLISAYARRGLVDHNTLDYTSALAFIEQNWGLAPLASRDRRATSLVSAFNFSAAPRQPALISNTALPPPQSKLKSTSIVFYSYGAAVGLVALAVGSAFGMSGLKRNRPTRSALAVPDAAAVKIGVDSR